jgi:hypothetical protein
VRLLGLIAHWKLDEGSGNVAADSSGFGNHGSIADPNWVVVDGRTGVTMDSYFAGWGNPAVILPPDTMADCAQGYTITYWAKMDGSPAQWCSVIGSWDKFNHWQAPVWIRHYQNSGDAGNENMRVWERAADNRHARNRDRQGNAQNRTTKSESVVDTWAWYLSSHGTRLFVQDDTPEGYPGYATVGNNQTPYHNWNDTGTPGYASADGTRQDLVTGFHHYVNGEPIGTWTDLWDKLWIGPQSMEYFALGNNGANAHRDLQGEWYRGAISDVRIYNHPIIDVDVGLMYYAETGKSSCAVKPPGDTDGNCIVNLVELEEIMTKWLECGLVPDCIP